MSSTARRVFAIPRWRTGLIAGMVLLTAGVLGLHARGLWLAALVAVIVGLVGLRFPELGLFALIVAALVMPLAFGTGTEVSVNPATLLVPALMVVWLLVMLRQGKVGLVSSRTNTPMLLFLLAGLVSLLIGNALWDPSVPRSDNLILVQLAQWAIFVFSAAAYWLTGNLIRDVQQLQRLTFIFLVLGGLLAIMLLLPNGMSLSQRVATYALHRAPFWLLLTALSVGQLLFNRDLSKGWRAFLIVVVVAILVYAFGLQRERLSNMVGVVSAGGLLIVLRWRRLALILALLALLGSIIFFPALYDFAGGDAKWEESGGSRLTLIGHVITLTMRNPITGLGPAAYRAYGKTTSLYYEGAYYPSAWLSSHNNYVDLFSHVGLLGIGLFFWFAAEVIWLGWRLQARFTQGFSAGYVNGMLACWVGALVVMVFADWILPFVYNIGFLGFQASVLVWLFVGGLVTLEQLEPSEAQRDGAPSAVGKSVQTAGHRVPRAPVSIRPAGKP